MQQLKLDVEAGPLSSQALLTPHQFQAHLADFSDFGARALRSALPLPQSKESIPCFTNEFWTARQRAANALHEISYRACFKPQLPRFFIERLTQPGARVYDPFMGRGTTLVEAALLGRHPVGCDVNPLSVVLTRPRLNPPSLEEIQARLQRIPWNKTPKFPKELLVFYHPETLREICNLRAYLMQQQTRGNYDPTDDWISMVALNRLTGHSAGFFSVYTLPPNQAVSVQSQRRINERRKQTPPRRHVSQIILKKSRTLLSECTPEIRTRLHQAAKSSLLVTGPAASTPEIASNSIDLAVTSPPFLNVVQYATDNWLRCWFLGIDPAAVNLTMTTRLVVWKEAMSAVFVELNRVLKPGGYVAFEVGEIQRGSLALEDAVLPCGLEASLKPVLLMVNAQEFTKTAQCWGVDNNTKGTNTNRIVLFQKQTGDSPKKRSTRGKSAQTLH